MMGSIVMASSLTSFFIKIPCHAGLLTGEDNHAVINARERHLQRLQYESSQAEATEQVDAAVDRAETGEGGNEMSEGTAEQDAGVSAVATEHSKTSSTQVHT
jgi:hypothetical protein